MMDGILMNSQELNVVKINLNASSIVYIIRAILLKKKVLLVSDKISLYEHYRRFFDSITQDSFVINLSFATKILYKLKRNDFQEFVVIGEDQEVFQDADTVIDQKKISIEENIVQKFFKITEILPSLIYLRRKIQRIYENSRKISKIAEKYNTSESKDYNQITKSLEGRSILYFQPDFLDLLIDVVENYFEVHVPSSLKLFLKNRGKKKDTY
jgi:hypothetical protein